MERWMDLNIRDPACDPVCEDEVIDARSDG